jgi:hypothetical protein
MLKDLKKQDQKLIKGSIQRKFLKNCWNHNQNIPLNRQTLKALKLKTITFLGNANDKLP